MAWDLGICDHCDEMVGQANLVCPPAPVGQSKTLCPSCYRESKEGARGLPGLRLA